MPFTQEPASKQNSPAVPEVRAGHLPPYLSETPTYNRNMATLGRNRGSALEDSDSRVAAVRVGSQATLPEGCLHEIQIANNLRVGSPYG
jgi:hypothetical protein